MDADLMVVGQDWGTTDYFLKWKGLDQSQGNPTNDNLRRLLHSIGVEIHPPGADQRGEIFLTNAILCLKQGNLQAPVRDEWFRNCGRKFLKPQIQIVKPKVVVALGNKAFRAILNAYGIPYAWPRTYRRVVELGCVKLPKEILVFPVYHCGARVMNTHRDLEAQLNDWKPIGKALRSGEEDAV